MNYSSTKTSSYIGSHYVVFPPFILVFGPVPLTIAFLSLLESWWEMFGKFVPQFPSFPLLPAFQTIFPVKVNDVKELQLFITLHQGEEMWQGIEVLLQAVKILSCFNLLFA